MKTLVELETWLNKHDAKIAIAFAKGDWIIMVSPRGDGGASFGHGATLELGVLSAMGHYVEDRR
jgi:hypothetical protein